MKSGNFWFLGLEVVAWISLLTVFVFDWICVVQSVMVNNTLFLMDAMVVALLMVQNIIFSFYSFCFDHQTPVFH